MTVCDSAYFFTHIVVECSAAFSDTFSSDRDDTLPNNSQKDSTHHCFQEGYSSSFLHFQDSQSACKLQASGLEFVSDLIDTDRRRRRFDYEVSIKIIQRTTQVTGNIVESGM